MHPVWAVVGIVWSLGAVAGAVLARSILEASRSLELTRQGMSSVGEQARLLALAVERVGPSASVIVERAELGRVPEARR